MRNRSERIAMGIDRFVQNPVTNLVKGLVLLLIGLSDASRTFHEDVTHMRVQVGHGLIILGVFSILGALPHFTDGLESTLRFLESKKAADPETPGQEKS